MGCNYPSLAYAYVLISVHFLPEDASCQFTTKTQGPQPDAHVSPITQDTERVHSSSWGGGAAGTVGKSPRTTGRSWSPGAPEGQRAGSRDRSAPATSLDQVAVEGGGVT